MNELISRRLKAAREQRGLTQAQLTERLGFKDRQTVAAIEAAQRKMSAEELVRAIQALGLDLEYFTDPLRLVGEGRFNWRAAKRTDASLLRQFEESAGRWIAAYRELGPQRSRATSALKPRLPLTERSTYEDARAAAEALGQEWGLGEIPALHLETRLRENIGTLVLYVDAPGGISGAACLLPEISTILINRNEPEGRRHYDLAHEAFHLLTWEQMPPAHSEADVPRGGKGQRVEQLADNFASALLMPEHAIAPKWQARGDVEVHRWLNDTAQELLVSAVALKWRLVQLGWLGKSDLLRIHDNALVANGRPDKQQSVPKLFASELVQCLHEAVLKGQISVRRVAELFDMTLHDLAELFRDYGLPVPFEV
jgi:XRE family transcriptional regulator, fatty acid utilization regulator